jgi:hypothetical protein
VPKQGEVCAQMEHDEALNFGLRCNENINSNTTWRDHKTR